MRRLVILAGLATAVVLGSCSADEAVTTTAPEAAPLTKEAFVARANAACERVNEAGDDLDLQLEERFGDDPSPADVEAAMDLAVQQMLPAMRTMQQELAALVPPEDARTMWDAALAQMDEVIDGTEQDPMAVLGDPTALDNPEAVAYGLDGCFTESGPTKFEPVDEAIPG